MSALALDRQAIEKKDFPISRRGYEPEAVDAHLAAVASEVERLQNELARSQQRPATAAAPTAGVQSLAVVASEQVRMIVEAAESSASDIERSAEEQAARIRADADDEARQVREEAVQRSEEHVGRVGEVTSGMLQRVDAMEQELGTLLQGLRTGTHRLTADLGLLQGNLGELHGPSTLTSAGVAAPAPSPVSPADAAPASPPVPAPAPAAPSPAAAPPPPLEPEPQPEPEPAAEAPVEVAGSLQAEPIEELPAPPPPPAPEPLAAAPEPPAAVARPDGDVEGARLIALNMALNGQSRAETDQYLGENFDLADRRTLLDEVYATVEG